MPTIDEFKARLAELERSRDILVSQANAQLSLLTANISDVQAIIALLTGTPPSGEDKENGDDDIGDAS